MVTPLLRAVPLLLLVSLMGVPACKIGPPPSPERSLEARAEELLLSENHEGAAALFQKLAETAKRPEDKARALVGVARAQMKLESYRKALDSLYAARRLCEVGPMRQAIERQIGEALFQNHDYGVAWGYLERSLPLVAGEERARLLVELHICAQKCLDSAAAACYLAEAGKTLSPQLREILRSHLEPPLPGHAPAPATPPPAVAVRPRLRPEPEREPPPHASGGIHVLPRGSWNARPVRQNVDLMGKISCVTVHHTGGPTFWGRSAEEAADEIRKIQRVHQQENRWADIGYHFIIDRVGRVWQGRPLSLQGAHANGPANRGNIGVVLLGNYLQQDMTEGQYRTLRNLVARLCRIYGIPPAHVYTHSEIRSGYTDCPGPALTRAVEDIRRSL